MASKQRTIEVTVGLWQINGFLGQKLEELGGLQPRNFLDMTWTLYLPWRHLQDLQVESLEYEQAVEVLSGAETRYQILELRAAVHRRRGAAVDKPNEEALLWV
jgi:hypothetical protein